MLTDCFKYFHDHHLDYSHYINDVQISITKKMDTNDKILKAKCRKLMRDSY